MKKSNGMELPKFSIEEVWKMIFKNAWGPCTAQGFAFSVLSSECLKSMQELFTCYGACTIALASHALLTPLAHCSRLRAWSSYILLTTCS